MMWVCVFSIILTSVFFFQFVFSIASFSERNIRIDRNTKTFHYNTKLEWGSEHDWKLWLSAYEHGPNSNMTCFLPALKGFPMELPQKERGWSLDVGQKFPAFVVWMKTFKHSKWFELVSDCVTKGVWQVKAPQRIAQDPFRKVRIGGDDRCAIVYLCTKANLSNETTVKRFLKESQ